MTIKIKPIILEQIFSPLNNSQDKSENRTCLKVIGLNQALLAA